MPLVKSASKKAVGENIKREEEAGKPRKQAIAIALDVARRAGAKIPKKHKESKMAHKEKPHMKEKKEHHHEHGKAHKKEHSKTKKK